MTRPPVTVVLAGLLAAGGIIASIWRPVAPDIPSLTHAQVAGLDRLAPTTEAAIAAYRSPRLVVAIVAMLLAVLVPVAAVATSGGRAWMARVARLGSPPVGAATFWRGSLLAAGIALAVGVATLPLAVWAGIVHDGDWRIRTASAGLWFRDRLGSMAIEVVLIAVVGGVAAVVVARRPRSWHGDLTLAGVAATAALTLVWPVLVEPLFISTTPLQDPLVQQVVDDLAAPDSQPLPVEVAAASSRTSRINARVVGLGPTRRMVLDDTLLERPLDEVRAVVGHELAHDRNRDVERAVLASAVGLLLALGAVRWVWAHERVRDHVGATRPDDVRIVAVGLAVVSVLVLVGQPVALWQSRRVESAADASSFDLGVTPQTAIALQRRLSIENLQPMESSWLRRLLFGTHPDPAERIRRAVAVDLETTSEAGG